MGIDWDKLREELAEEEHNTWGKWAASIMVYDDIDINRRKRWVELLTPYKNLSKKEKDKDRRQADVIIALIKKYDTIQQKGSNDQKVS